MTRSLTRANWAMPFLLVVLMSGCGTDSDSTSGTESTGDSTQSEATQPTDFEIASAVDVRPEDLPGKYGSTDRFGERGDLVDGYVSLDLCGADFESEALRTARHQVAYSAPDGDLISTETIAYEPGGAELAMGELRDAVSLCPKGFVESKVAGQPVYKARFQPLAGKADWQEDTVAMRVSIAPKKGAVMSGAWVYQRRGDVITAVYVSAGPQTSPELAGGIASLLSERLTAAAPSAGTNL